MYSLFFLIKTLLCSKFALRCVLRPMLLKKWCGFFGSLSSNHRQWPLGNPISYFSRPLVKQPKHLMAMALASFVRLWVWLVTPCLLYSLEPSTIWLLIISSYFSLLGDTHNITKQLDDDLFPKKEVETKKPW